MSKKPILASGYSKTVTETCERVLVTLLNGLGPYKDSVFLVGGLAPRYIAQAFDAPAHAGTGDLDIVIDQIMLSEVGAYHTLAENLTAMGFEPLRTGGVISAWQWKIHVGINVVVLDLLTESPDLAAAVNAPLPTGGEISALNMPHVNMARDLHETIEVTAELLNGDGMATETIKVANLACFTCLKAFALDHRGERKDASDLVYCLEHAEGGLAKVAAQFNEILAGPHAASGRLALTILRKRFCDDEHGEGYKKDGPTKAANFEGDLPTGDAAAKQARLIRQRHISELVTELLTRIAPPTTDEQSV